LPIRPRFPVKQKQEGFWKHWSLWGWFIIAILLTLGGVTLWKSGRWLVYEDSFEKVGWAIVLAGESRDCERTDAGIRLFQEGRVDTLVLSACRVFKNRYQSEFMIDYVVGQGVPRGNLFEFRQDAYSTLEEARLLIRQFRLQKLDTVLIITSNYHTARTRRIFRKLAQGYPQVLVYPAEYHTYDPAAWWSNRESRKYWMNEWLKTIYTWVELFRAPAELGSADFQNLVPDIWSGQATVAVDTPLMVLPDSQSSKIVPLAIKDSTLHKQGNDTTKKSDSTVAPTGAIKTRDDSIQAFVLEKAKPEARDSVLAKDSSVKNAVKVSVEKPVHKDTVQKVAVKTANKDSAVKTIAKATEKRPFPRAEKTVVAKSVKKVAEKAKKKGN
jgi:uncharacterized SAM-binding protein YcdF (DUF218 family)